MSAAARAAAPPTRRRLLSSAVGRSSARAPPPHLRMPPSFAVLPPFEGATPPAAAAAEQPIPTTQVTTLSNGLRVASQETYTRLSTVGVCIDAGSIHEPMLGLPLGCAHFVELLSFKSTAKRSHDAMLAEAEAMGGLVTASAGREQTLYCVDVLRGAVPESVDLLADAVLKPTYSPDEVDEASQVLQYVMADIAPDTMLKEAVQEAAYGAHQPLGRRHFCPSADAAPITSEVLHKYHSSLVTPERTVLAGTGVDHESLVALAETHFGAGAGFVGGAAPLAAPAVSAYSGGEARWMADHEVEPLTRVAVACEIGGWSDDDLVPACVLQVLLGGGDSFSAGGPGKGMYSRLYRDVLNTYYWVDAAEAFTSIHAEGGLLGIAGAAEPRNAGHLVRIFYEHLAKLAVQPVDEVALSRARNMLRCNVLTQLEARTVLFEDIARQLLTYGKRETQAEVCEKIDAVTAADVLRVGQRMMSKPPSVACFGRDISHVPTGDLLKASLQAF